MPRINVHWENNFLMENAKAAQIAQLGTVRIAFELNDLYIYNLTNDLKTIRYRGKTELPEEGSHRERLFS